MKNQAISWLGCLALVMSNCSTPSQNSDQNTPVLARTFAEDLQVMNERTKIMVLQEPTGKGRIAVSPALQARVMTSCANGPESRSYGWINRELFESGDTLEHINPFGGEERFWLGPEGGQFALFFPQGSKFDLTNWQTPALIDLEPFNVTDSTPSSAVFNKRASLVNYAGFQFDLEIERTVEILSVIDIFRLLQFGKDYKVHVVGYQTSNILTNLGEVGWDKETGLLSIWLLGMFNPSKATTVVLPFVEGPEEDLGPIVNDAYFGKVPEERLKVGPGAVFFNGDGTYRSKIGLAPARAKDIIGSYDSDNQVLTIIKYTKPEGAVDYVNSVWELQKYPYQGDVVNSYNDGPPEPGAKPMGPFYELETSSRALALGPGESAIHVQQTFHFEGAEEELNALATLLLGVSLEQINSAFPR